MTTARAQFKFFWTFEFWIWTNHNSLLSIATNQFASFCMDIRSRQCYFRVCQSGEIWNKKAFFPYFLIFYYIKQINSMLPCVCSVIDHRWRQNVVRTSVTHSAAPRVPLFCSYRILTSSVIYYWKDALQHGIYLLSNSFWWKVNVGNKASLSFHSRNFTPCIDLFHNKF